MGLMPLAPESRHTVKSDGRPYTENDKQFFELTSNGGIRRFVHMEYPKMLYRASRGDGGIVRVESVVAQGEADEPILRGQGWTDHPTAAKDRLEGLEQDVARAAAERAASDATMGERARAEAQAATEASDVHLGEIPVTPKKRGRPRKDAV
jgi:hypothetical protein